MLQRTHWLQLVKVRVCNKSVTWQRIAKIETIRLRSPKIETMTETKSQTMTERKTIQLNQQKSYSKASLLMNPSSLTKLKQRLKAQQRTKMTMATHSKSKRQAARTSPKSMKKMSPKPMKMTNPKPMKMTNPTVERVSQTAMIPREGLQEVDAHHP